MDILINWGCCSSDIDGESYVTCLKCSKAFHYACLALDISSVSTEMEKIWTCPECVENIRVSKTDDTPVRNISTTRGNKRVALNSPPMAKDTVNITREDIRNIVQEVFKEILADTLSKFNDTINNEIKPLRDQICSLTESMALMNSLCSDAVKRNELSESKITTLESENAELKSNVQNLFLRCNNLEQQLRQTNIEIQCIPERKSENLLELIKCVGKVIGCEIVDSDIMHFTRVAKRASIPCQQGSARCD
ncbi:unnamed protein product [Leptosia nina]|uniref:PHD-type domain-containing protein n=1 Tax=Leptosia nina TaxID=320188 RepID=A0AAV1JSQ1_9NEOP